MSQVGHVTTVEHDGRTIHIIGTAHISARSVEEVRRVIEELRPDSVCVELDATRFEALTDPARWRKLDVFQVLRQKKVLFLLSSMALANYQRRLGKEFGVQPGAEMLEAVHAAREVGAELVLADRDVSATLKRTWANLGFWSRSQVLALLLGVSFSRQQIGEEQIEQLKDKDTISEVMKEFAREFPAVKGPLIDERDRYLISKVREAPGKTIVAVVGAGHVEGMVAELATPVDRAALEVIPRPSAVARALPWLIPTIVMAAFGVGIYRHGGETLDQMLSAWIYPHLLFTFLGAVVALPHPLTAIGSALASPLTALNPTIHAGMIAGLMEAWLRRPTVEECERVSDDLETFRGIYRNGVLRVLLVSVTAAIGSGVGTWLGVAWLVALLT